MRSLLVLVLVAGCGNGGSKPAPAEPAPPPPPDAAPAATQAAPPADQPIEQNTAQAAGRQADPVVRAVNMFIAIAEVMGNAGNDCPRMSSDLDAWLNANDAERKEIMEQLAALPEAERNARFQERMADHKDALASMQSALQACGNDPQFAEVWKRLDM